MIAVIMAAYSIFSQFSSPSDACDSCKLVCENIYKNSGSIIENGANIDTLWKRDSSDMFLLERSKRTYRRIECKLQSSVDSFLGAKWRLQSSSPIKCSRLDSIEHNNVYFGLKCDSTQRTFISNTRYKRIPRKPGRADSSWKLFSWQKWRHFGFPSASSTCQCGLAFNKNGEDRYLEQCKIPTQYSVDVIPLEIKRDEKVIWKCGTFGSISVTYNPNSQDGERIKMHSWSGIFDIHPGNDTVFTIATSRDTITLHKIRNSLE